MSLRSRDWAVVKSREEILASVDGSGKIDGMPFMAEMLQYCGQKLQVSAVAHKTCDTIKRTGGRRVKNAVHLKGIRCDGSAHGGCQAACLIFWKTDWLRAADGKSGDDPEIATASPMSESELRETGSRVENGELVYSCQATQLYEASSPLRWWDFRQYAVDLWCGNVRVGRILRVALLRAIYHLRSLGIGYRAALALHDRVHMMLTGRASPYKDGLIPVGQATPTESLNLLRGEWVEVRSHEEIRATNTERNYNRGMQFDPEMAQFCGRRFKVTGRVERLIDERTGRMRSMKSPCIVLDGVVCSADYSRLRLFCPREIPLFFREIWLRRAPADGGGIADPGKEI